MGNKGGIPFEEQFFGWNTFTSITVHLFPLIINQAKLSDMLDIPLKTLNERLRHKNMSVNKLDEMLRVMGYKIMVVPRDTKVENGFDVK